MTNTDKKIKFIRISFAAPKIFTAAATLLGIVLTAGILALFLSATQNIQNSAASTSAGGNRRVYSPLASPTPTSTTLSRLFLPMIIEPDNPPAVNLDKVTTIDTAGNERRAFLPGEPIKFLTSGLNQYETPATVNLSWVQSSPCDSPQVFTATMTLEPGA